MLLEWLDSLTLQAGAGSSHPPQPAITNGAPLFSLLQLPDTKGTLLIPRVMHFVQTLGNQGGRKWAAAQDFTQTKHRGHLRTAIWLLPEWTSYFSRSHRNCGSLVEAMAQDPVWSPRAAGSHLCGLGCPLGRAWGPWMFQGLKGISCWQVTWCRDSLGVYLGRNTTQGRQLLQPHVCPSDPRPTVPTSSAAPAQC